MCSSRSQRGFLNEFAHTRFCDLYHRSFIYGYSLNHDEQSREKKNQRRKI